MLNNGGLSGGSSCSSGMGTPDGSVGGIYNGASLASPSEYPPTPSSNPSSMSHPSPFHPHLQQHPYPPHHPHHPHHHHHHPHHPHREGGGPPPGGMGNGMMGHHSGGICSQMGLGLNQESKMRSCGGCGEMIMDKVLFEAWDRYWHHSCLKCTMCGSQLADMGPTCFSRDGMMLCKPDYIKMFGIKGACRGCGQHIPSHEFVMRAGASPLGGPPMVFHVNCFTCSKCGKTLSTGDRYSVLNGALFCEQDALKVMKQNGIGSPSNANVSAPNGPTTAPRKGKVGRPRRSRD